MDNLLACLIIVLYIAFLCYAKELIFTIVILTLLLWCAILIVMKLVDKVKEWLGEKKR